MASKADVWLQPRPATDAALALGMLHVIIKARLYDSNLLKSGVWALKLSKREC
jgi:anaerobic selenocysteine-containing dehydrogenase